MLGYYNIISTSILELRKLPSYTGLQDYSFYKKEEPVGKQRYLFNKS